MTRWTFRLMQFWRKCPFFALFSFVVVTFYPRRVNLQTPRFKFIIRGKNYLNHLNWADLAVRNPAINIASSPPTFRPRNKWLSHLIIHSLICCNFGRLRPAKRLKWRSRWKGAAFVSALFTVERTVAPNCLCLAGTASIIRPDSWLHFHL